MTDQQPLVGVLICPDESPDIRTDQDSPPRGTRETAVRIEAGGNRWER